MQSKKGIPTTRMKTVSPQQTDTSERVEVSPAQSQIAKVPFRIIPVSSASRKQH